MLKNMQIAGDKLSFSYKKNYCGQKSYGGCIEVEILSIEEPCEKTSHHSTQAKADPSEKLLSESFVGIDGEKIADGCCIVECETKSVKGLGEIEDEDIGRKEMDEEPAHDGKS